MKMMGYYLVSSLIVFPLVDVYIVTCNWQMSGSRMKVAGRFKPCAHMGCFDLQTFIELNQRSRKASGNLIS